MQISTADKNATFTFNGNGHTLDGQGELYWDGKGSAGRQKPVSKNAMSSRNAGFLFFNEPNCFYAKYPMVALEYGGGAFRNVVCILSSEHKHMF